MTPLEAAARELAQYNTIPEMVETVWPDCVNPARAAISAFLKACAEDEALARIMHERARASSNGKYRWDDPIEMKNGVAFGVDKAFWRKAARETCDDILSALEPKE